MKYSKSFLSLIFLASLSASAFGQASNLRKAKTNIENYEGLRQTNGTELGKTSLETAKTAIDEAIIHEKTKDNPDTWATYSLVYANLALINKSDDLVAKASDGITKAKELDTQNKHTSYITTAGDLLNQYAYAMGKEAWDKQDFPSAYKAFDNGLKINPKDTSLMYYAGIAAIQSKDYPNAIKKYNQILAYPTYSEYSTVLLDLPKLYISAQDTANAILYAGKAAKELPDNSDAAIQNIELNITTGRAKEIIKDIESQTQKEPNNKLLFYYLGVAYNAAEEPDKATKAFIKAVELDPNFLEANVNVSVNILNAARDKVFTLNEKKDLPANDYNKQIAEIRKEITAAEVYLLKAAELEPTSLEHVQRLKNFYDFTQNEAKSVEYQKKIDSMQ